MSPQLATPPHGLAGHPQRPWRAVDVPPRRAPRPVSRQFAAAVVRELPPRRQHAAGGW